MRPEASVAEALPRERRWPFWAALGVLAVGLLATAALTFISSGLYTRNEKRLLKLRARDVGTALTSALPSIQTPLASAAALADATGGNVPRFKRLVAAYVGQAAGQPFASVSLWRLSDPARGPLAVVGAPPSLAPLSAQTSSFLRHASESSKLSVIGPLQGPHPRLGYAFTGTSSGPFVAYGESALPPGRYQPVQNNSAFNDLNYALYLGSSPNPADLLVASVRHVPLSPPRARVRVAFGDTSFLVSVKARGPLAGSLPQRLPWVIAIVGTLLALGACALTARLIDRRRRIEDVAAENRRLYAEQRGIAQTLQHALLPDRSPQLPGLQASARYEAGVDEVDIGGDWYDLIELEDHRLLLASRGCAPRRRLTPAAVGCRSSTCSPRNGESSGEGPARRFGSPSIHARPQTSMLSQALAKS